MKFGFMSSVCPPLTVAELIDKAKHYNYKHLELRVEWDHGHGVELDSTPQQLQEARHRFTDSGIELSCIATGVRFIDPDAQNAPNRWICSNGILICPKRWARRIFGFSGIGAGNTCGGVPDFGLGSGRHSCVRWLGWRCGGCTLFGDTRQSYRELRKLRLYTEQEAHRTPLRIGTRHITCDMGNPSMSLMYICAARCGMRMSTSAIVDPCPTQKKIRLHFSQRMDMMGSSLLRSSIRRTQTRCCQRHIELYNALS